MTRPLWTPPAIADLEAIDDYWSDYNVESAERVASKIEAAAGFLCESPRAGTPLDDGQARKWRVATTPYLIVYRSRAETIEVLRVYHARTNWREDL